MFDFRFDLHDICSGVILQVVGTKRMSLIHISLDFTIIWLFTYDHTGILDLHFVQMINQSQHVWLIVNIHHVTHYGSYLSIVRGFEWYDLRISERGISDQNLILDFIDQDQWHATALVVIVVSRVNIITPEVIQNQTMHPWIHFVHFSFYDIF